MVTFQKNAGQSDGDGVLSWFKPPQSLDPLYPAGFSTQVNWIASKYAAPIPGQRVLQLPDSPANLRVTLAGGNVAGFAPFSVTLDRKNIVTGNGGVGFKLILTPATGAFSGSFIDQSTHTLRSFSGSVFQEQNLGSGFFIGSGETGVVLLESSSTTTVRSDGSGVEP